MLSLSTAKTRTGGVWNESASLSGCPVPVSVGEGWSGSVLGDRIFWLESHGQVAPCPFPTASGYKDTFFTPSPSSPYSATGSVLHRQKNIKNNSRSTSFSACWQVTLDDHRTRQIDCCFLNICPSKFVRFSRPHPCRVSSFLP